MRLLILFLWLFSAVNGFSSPFSFKTCKDLIEKGNYEQAKKMVRKAMKDNKNDFDLWAFDIKLSRVLGDEKRLEMHRKYFQKAYAKKRLKSAKALTLYGDCIGRHDPSRGIAVYEEALALDKTYAGAYVGLIDLLLSIHGYGHALKYTREMPSKNAAALVKKARVQIIYGLKKQALANLDNALSRKANDTEALNLKGYLWLQAYNMPAALEYFKKSLAINPHNPETLSLFAVYYNLEGETKKRETYIAKTLAVNPRYHGLYNMLSTFAAKGVKIQAAKKWADKAIAIAPEHWKGHFLKAINVLRLGEEKKGFDLLKAAYEKNKFNKRAEKLLDVLNQDFKYRRYLSVDTKHFRIKVPKTEAYAILPYLKIAVEKNYDELSKKYGFIPKGTKESNGKILLTFISSAKDFTARTGAPPNVTGVCYGQRIIFPSPHLSMNTPHAQSSWISTVKHEFMHVISLQQSKYKIPRWFTEGLSLMEDSSAHFELRHHFVNAIKRGMLLPIEKVEVGLISPLYPNQVGVSYYQAMLACQFINEKHGFKAMQKMIELYAAGKKTPEILTMVTSGSLASLNADLMKYYIKHLVVLQKLKVPERVKEVSKILAMEDKVKNKNPSDDMWRRILVYFLDNKEYDGGITAANFLVQKGVEQYDLYMLLGEMYQAKEATQKAIEACERAIAINPFGEDAHRRLQRLYKTNNNLKKARREAVLLKHLKTL